jgi:excinuclease UvrABC nuclease subunit
MKHGSQLRVGRVLVQLEELLSKPPEKMKDAVDRYPKRHGVYVISDPEDSEIVYVGMSRTAKEGVGQRLKDHLNNKEAAVLKSMVGGDKKKAEQYFVRIIEVDDNITRRNLEALAIGALSPKFNK